MTMRQLIDYMAAHPYGISDYKIVIRQKAFGGTYVLDQSDIIFDHKHHEIILWT